MNDLTVVEIKAFVPARDFALSKRFYVDLGFELAWSDENLAYLKHGEASFLLQNFCEPADNFMMHMLVKDVDAWWRRVQARDLVGKYGVMAQPPEVLIPSLVTEGCLISVSRRGAGSGGRGGASEMRRQFSHPAVQAACVLARQPRAKAL